MRYLDYRVVRLRLRIRVLTKKDPLLKLILKRRYSLNRNIQNTSICHYYNNNSKPTGILSTEGRDSWTGVTIFPDRLIFMVSLGRFSGSVAPSLGRSSNFCRGYVKNPTCHLPDHFLKSLTQKFHRFHSKTTHLLPEDSIFLPRKIFCM